MKKIFNSFFQKRVFPLILAFIIFDNHYIYAVEVLLSWGPVQKASGYVIYYGNATKTYTWKDNTDNQTSYPITDFLIKPRKHYFAVRSYDDNNTFSELSQEYLIDFSSYDRDKDDAVVFFDNCPDIANPDQKDVDSDGIGDACENSEKTSDNSTSDNATNIADALGVTNGSSSTTTIPNNNSGNSGGGGSNSGGGYADTSSGSSTGCKSDDDCSDNLLCDISSGLCVQCIKNLQCDDGLYCNGMERCVNNQCRTGANPCGETELCDEQIKTCAPPPECYDDQDCNDGLFCNGEEHCADGSCVSGETPCDSQQVCKEDTDKCLDMTYVQAQSLQQIIWRPFFFKQRCSLLVIDSQGTTHFDSRQSKISLRSYDDEDNPEGITIDASQAIQVYSRFILIPICITSQAKAGSWSVQIVTESIDDDLFVETVEATFEIK